MKRHLTEVDLERYLTGEINLLERIRFTHHLESCESCRKQKNTQQERINFLHDFKQGIARMGEAEKQVRSICTTSGGTHKE